MSLRERKEVGKKSKKAEGERDGTKEQVNANTRMGIDCVEGH